MVKKKFNDQPFPYHHELELEITTLTNLGVGLGRVPLNQPKAFGFKPQGAAPLEPRARATAAEKHETKGENAAGWVVMVPFTLPGERVRARIYRNHRNYSEADLLEVLAPSPQRVEPRCPLFARCGGCQYQHLTYAEQLAWKRRQVQELLEHLAGVSFPVAPVVPSPREYGYRSKITPHFPAPPRGKAGSSAKKPVTGEGEGVRQDPAAAPSPSSETVDREPRTFSVPIGFLKQGSRFDLVDVPACPIATPEINARLAEVRARTHARLASGEYERGATLLLRQAQEGVVTDYDAVIHELITPSPSTPNAQPGSASPLRLHFLARDFFQNNPFILPAFTGYVRGQAAAGGARFLVDAYCGSGLFALACAPAFERVVGIEVSESSIRFARENAADNGIAHATFRAGDASAIFAGLEFPPAETVVVIDPPRKGCDELFLTQLFAFGPRAVVYVSCDPATQMRDLKAFLAQGYALTAVQPFDLFPQTRHLECVITLTRLRG